MPTNPIQNIKLEKMRFVPFSKIFGESEYVAAIPKDEFVFRHLYLEPPLFLGEVEIVICSPTGNSFSVGGTFEMGDSVVGEFLGRIPKKDKILTIYIKPAGEVENLPETIFCRIGIVKEELDMFI